MTRASSARRRADGDGRWLPVGRWSLAAAAIIVLALSGTPAFADGPATMEEAVTIEGVLTDEGVTCPALRGDDGELYTLAGDIGDLQPGQRVRVTGRLAEMSICMQGTTIDVSRISLLSE